ncbi:Glutathione dehydrogenase [Fasciola hepatica]|uniref:Glutathione dehydrogenase n=1 Tax=Fasciola hepatica TaxID=6192 RepID=A0A4E0RKQ9_FASHE|nr:Glutathione dehydrogenase [Fasciola hepatica]
MMAVVGDTINIVKHLKSGDPAPEINPSKYTLFAYRFCPFCDRVRLTLNHHKIEHDLVLIALADKPDWFKQMSPSGKVPMLLNEGAKLIESDLIMRFVDELRGTDAQLLGVCGMDKFNEALALTSKYYKPAHTILFKESYNSEDETTFRSACGELDKQIKGKYFAGDQLSLADFALFPVLDRLEVIMNQLTKHTAPDHVTE